MISGHKVQLMAWLTESTTFLIESCYIECFWRLLLALQNIASNRFSRRWQKIPFASYQFESLISLEIPQENRFFPELALLKMAINRGSKFWWTNLKAPTTTFITFHCRNCLQNYSFLKFLLHACAINYCSLSSFMKTFEFLLPQMGWQRILRSVVPRDATYKRNVSFTTAPKKYELQKINLTFYALRARFHEKKIHLQ